MHDLNRGQLSNALTYASCYLDLGLRVTAKTVTDKLMPVLQVCQADRSHPYF